MPAKPVSVEFERRKRALFEAALQLPEASRIGFIMQQTTVDPELRTAVLRMLTAQAAGSEGILDTPLHPKPVLENAIPARIGPYVVMRSLGVGGMGSVYCCCHPMTGEPVAVKVVHVALQGTSFVKRFARERDILTKLKHPNVCRILDAGVAEHGTPYIVMEMVNGRPIDQFCRGLELSRVLRLFSQLLAGVEYFHRRDVVHRDLKPANVLVLPSGHVRILDFGIAKIIDHHPGSTGHGPTRSTAPMMTVRYASPEQLKGHVSGRASDIYAVGVMLYELLSGRHPFAEEYLQGPIRLLSAMSRRSPTPPSEFQPSNALTPAIDKMTLSALEFDPMRRYRTAGDFLNDLRMCLEAESAASGA
jgi:serine/threonine protein kinase